jgi:hypothetical protein
MGLVVYIQIERGGKVAVCVREACTQSMVCSGVSFGSGLGSAPRLWAKETGAGLHVLFPLPKPKAACILVSHAQATRRLCL